MTKQLKQIPFDIEQYKAGATGVLGDGTHVKYLACLPEGLCASRDLPEDFVMVSYLQSGTTIQHTLSGSYHAGAVAPKSRQNITNLLVEVETCKKWYVVFTNNTDKAHNVHVSSWYASEEAALYSCKHTPQYTVLSVGSITKEYTITE